MDSLAGKLDMPLSTQLPVQPVASALPSGIIRGNAPPLMTIPKEPAGRRAKMSHLQLDTFSPSMPRGASNSTG